MNGLEKNFKAEKTPGAGTLENPITQKIMSVVAEKMQEIGFSDTFKYAKNGKWELADARVTVFIDDASVVPNDRNINLDIRVPVAELEQKINEGIIATIEQRNYQNPVVEAVLVETAGYTFDNVEIETGIYRRSAPAAR